MIAPIVDSVAAHSRVSIPCDLHPGSLLEQARGREEEFATGAFYIRCIALYSEYAATV